MGTTSQAVNWLLDSGESSIRYFTLTEVLGRSERDEEVKVARENIPDGPIVRILFSGQLPDGSFGNHPYSKWTGAHWRLVSLVEQGIAPGYEPAIKATTGVLDWLTGTGHVKGIKQVNGLTRRCASQEGNGLAVCSRLGLASDPRVRQLAESLVYWQWPDGGWNCDRRPDVKHSSFNESLATLWGLVEYYHATGDQKVKQAGDRAAEFFLRHRIFRSCRSNEERPTETFHGAMFRMVHPWTSLHYPVYWHYDILQALLILGRAGKLGDSRTSEALDMIEGKRGQDGLWGPDAFYWHSFGGRKVMGEKWRASTDEWKKTIVSNVEVVDWGRKGPNKMLTLNSLRVLKAAGRL